MNQKEVLFEGGSWMDSMSAFKDAVLNLFPPVAARLRPGDEDLGQCLDDAERELRGESAVLVVLGRYDRGKSTLLNALLEDPELLPRDSGAATRLVVTIRAGVTEKIVVRLADPPEEREITRAELRRYANEAADDPPADRARATEAIIELPHPKLAGGLTILDTPGMGSLFSKHALATLGVLPTADAVLYVTDASQPLLSSELAFIQQIAEALDLPAHPGRLLFAITKIDLVADREESVADLRDRLLTVPGAEQALIVPVSAQLRLDHLASGDPLDLEFSNLPALEAELWPAVRRVRARLRLGTALNELGAVLDTLLEPVEQALAALAAQDEQTRAELAKKSEELLEELASRTGAAEQVPSEVADLLAAHTEGILRDADNRLSDLWRELRAAYRTDEGLRDDPQRLLDLLAARLAVLTADLAAEAEQAVTAVREEFAARIGHRVRAPLRRLLPAAPMPAPFAPAGVHYKPSPVAGIAQAIEAAADGARAGAEAGARFGSVIWAGASGLSLPQAKGAALALELAKALNDKSASPGDPGSIVGRTVGTVVGATLTFANELVAIHKLVKAERIDALDVFFSTWETDQRAFFQASLTELMDGHATVLGADIRGYLERRRETAEKAVAQVAQAQAAAAEGAGSADLEERREALLALSREVDRLAKTVGFAAA
ncbi:dynamin family protein [Actinomadura formosensis]|uniref:dynamin family protein n=1 Tax=Actinomadura formosensis TaxID=60706 RepID=UPI003D906E7F